MIVFLLTLSLLQSILFWIANVISTIIFWAPPFLAWSTKAFFQHVSLSFGYPYIYFSYLLFCVFFLGVPVSIVFRYFFPPMDSPRAGSRWSSYTQLLPPPLIEHSCNVDTTNLQYPHPRRRYISRPLNLLREHEGV